MSARDASSRGRIQTPLWLGVFVLLVTVRPVPDSEAAAQDILPPTWENAVLDENWPRIMQLCESDTGRLRDPVARWLAGHAGLALNKNNRSVRLLLSINSVEDLKTCREWIGCAEAGKRSGLVGRYPRSAIAHYLRGDVLARQGDLDAALAALQQAGELQPRHPLVLNARGVVLAMKQRWSESLVSLFLATQADPQLADAQANLGALWVQKKDGATGAIQAFDHAIFLSTDGFAVAQYGRGCVRSVMGQWKDATQDLVEVAQQENGLPKLLQQETLAMVARIREQERAGLACGDKTDASTELNRRFDAIETTGNLGVFNVDHKRIVAILENNPHLMPLAQQRLKRMEIRSPAAAEQFGQATFAGQGRNKFAARMAAMMAGIQLGKDGTVSVGIDSTHVKENWTARFDLRAGALHLRDAHLHRARVESDLMKGLSKSGASGFKTSLQAALYDDGNWPFRPLYGLAYDVHRVHRQEESQK